MNIYHDFHLPHFHLARTGPLLRHSVMRKFAVSMATLFSPVYVYQEVLELGASQAGAIAASMIFIASIYLGKMLVTPIVLRQAHTNGLKSVLRIASIIQGGYFLGMGFLGTIPIMLLPLGFFWGVAAGYFWVGYHSFFIHLGDGDHFGEEVGFAQVMNMASGFVAPLAGGILVEQVGFFWLFVVSAVIVIASLVPLRHVDEHDGIESFSWHEAWDQIKSHRREAIAYGGQAGTSVLNSAIWPLYIFLVLGSFFDLGAIVAISMMLAGAVTLIAGELSDRKGKLAFIKLGGLGVSTAWIARIFARSIFGFVATDMLFQTFFRVLVVPLDAFTYQKARTAGTGMVMIFREALTAFSACVTLVVGALLIYVGMPLVGLFGVAAVLALGPLRLQMIRKHEER